MSKVTDIVNELVKPILDENNLELWNTELVKEGKDWFLRVYIDKIGDYVSTDECEIVSRALSEELDRKDPIEQNYYLEVSSPGMDRELIKPEHFERYKGQLIDVKLYKALNGRKEYEGILVDRNENGDLTIELVETNIDNRPGKQKSIKKTDASGESDKTLLINSELISKVRLAVIF